MFFRKAAKKDFQPEYPDSNAFPESGGRISSRNIQIRMFFRKAAEGFSAGIFRFECFFEFERTEVYTNQIKVYPTTL